MYDQNKKEKKSFDDEEDKFADFVRENWTPDEEGDEKHRTSRRNRVKRISKSFRASPIPPLPPVPPLPSLPPEIEIHKSDKVIGIRGLDARLYKDIGKIARKNGLSVAELINRLLAKYRYDSLGENGNTISNISTLELHEDELIALDDEIINIISVRKLMLGPDITPETFNKINRIEHVDQIWVPSHLYLLLLKKAKNCYNIEKYKGDRLPQVIQKSFDSDVHLTSSFMDYFLETNQKVDLKVYGDLKIDSDISLQDFKEVIYNLDVDGDIHAPKHLIGILFATAKCYGEIEATED